MLINGLTMPLASLNKKKSFCSSFCAAAAALKLVFRRILGVSGTDYWRAGARSGPVTLILRFLEKSCYRPLPSGQLGISGVPAALGSAGPLPGLGPCPGRQNPIFGRNRPFFHKFWAGQPPIVGYTGFERGEEKREKLKLLNW